MIPMKTPRREGVEEKKEEDAAEGTDQPISPRKSQSQENDEQERRHGFQAQVQNLASVVFGSCGTAIEAASMFVQGQACDQWQKDEPANNSPNGIPRKHEPPPLSIADELRKLAAMEGRPFPPVPPSGPRAADIPKYLGEDAVRSFEDDNISAISQHTLEEMAKNGIVHPATQRMIREKQQRQEQQGESKQARSSSPTRTHNTNSSTARRKREAAQAQV